MSQQLSAFRVGSFVEVNGFKIRGAHGAPDSLVNIPAYVSATTARKDQGTVKPSSCSDVSMDSEEYQDASLTPIDPSAANFNEQPVSQAPMRTSSGFASFERHVPWNSTPVAKPAVDNTSFVTIPGFTSQCAFIPPIPTVSGISTFDHLMATTWPYTGETSIQTPASSNPGSGSTKQVANPKIPTASMDNSGQRSQHHSVGDMSDAIEPITVDSSFEPLAEGVPNKNRKCSAGADTYESNQTTLSSGITSSQPTPQPRDNTIAIPNADLGSRATAYRGDANSTNGNGRRGCSAAKPRPIQEHRVRNRRAATKCRAKAKAATAELEATEREMELQHQELSAQASSLQDEVLTLKNELLLHGNCDCAAIQQYLTNAAKTIGSGMVQRKLGSFSSLSH